MFGIERLQAIRELIIEKKSVEVTYLSKELNVSEVTIRRDLDKLEKEGLVAKTYGGAILIEESVVSKTSALSELTNVDGPIDEEEYRAIAITAAKVIELGDTIFIGGGFSGVFLCHQLKDMENIIVVTTNIEIAMYIYSETNHKVVIIGGEVDSATGNVLEYEQLDDLLIEKAFISVDGVDEQFGYTVNEKTLVRQYKKLKEVSRNVIVMAPSITYNKRGLMKMALLNEISCVVTDKDLPDKFKSYYFENNIKVYSSILS